MLLMLPGEIVEGIDGVSRFEAVIAVDVVVWVSHPIAEAKQEAAEGFAKPSAHGLVTVGT